MAGYSPSAILEECIRVRKGMRPLAEKYCGVLDDVTNNNTHYPFVLLLGNHSSGKSSFVNFVLNKGGVQETGVAPTDDCFTIIGPGKTDFDRDGPTLVGDPDLGFGGLKIFGPVLVNHTQLKVRANTAVKDFMLVDSPGMIDSPVKRTSHYHSLAGRNSSGSRDRLLYSSLNYDNAAPRDVLQQGSAGGGFWSFPLISTIFGAGSGSSTSENSNSQNFSGGRGLTSSGSASTESDSKLMDRGYNFEAVCRWYAERADVILLFFDPDKPGTTGETLSILTNSLAGLDNKLHIILNKADQFHKMHDFARAYGSLCWNLSKVIPRKDLPRIHTMCIPLSDRSTNTTSTTTNNNDDNDNDVEKASSSSPVRSASHSSGSLTLSTAVARTTAPARASTDEVRDPHSSSSPSSSDISTTRATTTTRTHAPLLLGDGVDSHRAPAAVTGGGVVVDNAASDRSRSRTMAAAAVAAPNPFMMQGIKDLEEARMEVIQAVFQAPRRRVDNEISRLSDSVHILHMQCRIMDEAIRSYLHQLWHARLVIAATALTSVGFAIWTSYLVDFIENGSNGSSSSSIGTRRTDAAAGGGGGGGEGGEGAGDMSSFSKSVGGKGATATTKLSTSNNNNDNNNSSSKAVSHPSLRGTAAGTSNNTAPTTAAGKAGISIQNSSQSSAAGAGASTVGGGNSGMNVGTAAYATSTNLLREFLHLQSSRSVVALSATLGSCATLCTTLWHGFHLRRLAVFLSSRPGFVSIFRRLYARELHEGDESTLAVGEVVIDRSLPTNFSIDTLTTSWGVPKSDFQLLEKILKVDLPDLRRKASPNYPLVLSTSPALSLPRGGAGTGEGKGMSGGDNSSAFDLALDDAGSAATANGAASGVTKDRRADSSSLSVPVVMPATAVPPVAKAGGVSLWSLLGLSATSFGSVGGGGPKKNKDMNETMTSISDSSSGSRSGSSSSSSGGNPSESDVLPANDMEAKQHPKELKDVKDMKGIEGVKGAERLIGPQKEGEKSEKEKESQQRGRNLQSSSAAPALAPPLAASAAASIVEPTAGTPILLERKKSDRAKVDTAWSTTSEEKEALKESIRGSSPLKIKKQ